MKVSAMVSIPMPAGPVPVHRQGNSGALFLLCHPKLQMVADKAGDMGLKFHIIVSYRDPVLQMAAYKAGKSKAKPGQSAHNYKPSLAFDFIPLPFAGWNDIPQFRNAAHVFLAAGHLLGIPITWGGDWDGDGDEHDQTLFDADHIELTNWRSMR